MKSKHIIVVGGTRGLGQAVVSTLKKEGYKLSVIARTIPKNYSDLASQDVHDVDYFEANLLKDDSYLDTLLTIIKTRGQINGLIFVQRYRGKDDSWNGDLQVGLNATRKIIDYLKDHFETKTSSSHSITIVSSVAGLFANNSQALSYSIAKAGLNSMVKYYSSELGQYGIRVNAVSPIGFVKEESRQYYLDENKKINQIYEEIIPLKRMCTAQDVANVISLLCDQRASFISGQNIIVDGGLSVRAHETMAFELNEQWLS